MHVYPIFVVEGDPVCEASIGTIVPSRSAHGAADALKNALHSSHRRNAGRMLKRLGAVALFIVGSAGGGNGRLRCLLNIVQDPLQLLSRPMIKYRSWPYTVSRATATVHSMIDSESDRTQRTTRNNTSISCDDIVGVFPILL